MCKTVLTDGGDEADRCYADVVSAAPATDGPRVRQPRTGPHRFATTTCLPLEGIKILRGEFVLWERFKGTATKVLEPDGVGSCPSGDGIENTGSRCGSAYDSLERGEPSPLHRPFR